MIPVTRRDSAHVAEQLAAELGERDDSSLPVPLRFGGHRFLVLAGPHPDDGWCWCQPAMVPCPHGLDGHAHPAHEDRRH